MTEDQNDTPPPGHYIKQELEERGLAQRDLAYILGSTEQVVTRLLNGKHGISPDMAKALGTAFDVSPELFINLQAAFDLANAKDPDPGIATRASWQNIYPVREMINRGWIRENSALDTQMQKFFRAANSNDVRQRAHAAKKTNAGEPATPSQLAWLYRVIQLAESMDMSNAPFSSRALQNSQRSLQDLMNNPEDVRRVPNLLAACGLRFMVVETLSSAKIDGVCLWLDKSSPVIALTTRYDRIDNFWFVLWHEIIHVLNRDGQSEPIIDVELEGDQAINENLLSSQERKANSLAMDKCVPEGDMISFLARRDRFISEHDVLFFSKQKRVHPGIVIGQIQNRTKRWGLLRKYQVKVRQCLTSTAFVDGWGHVAPVSI